VFICLCVYVFVCLCEYSECENVQNMNTVDECTAVSRLCVDNSVDVQSVFIYITFWNVLKIETEYSGHCEKLVEEIDLKNYDAILACGGDGTQGLLIMSFLLWMYGFTAVGSSLSTAVLISWKKKLSTSGKKKMR